MEDVHYLHAGVVAWRDRAIVIPASPGSGTSTLVAALVRRGARAYADGRAVIDASGRTPSLLPDPAAAPPVPVVLVVSTTYRPAATWEPVVLRGARALLPLLEHLEAIADRPAVGMRLATMLGPHIVTLESPRPDADAVAPVLLEFTDRLIDGGVTGVTSVRRANSTGAAQLPSTRAAPSSHMRVRRPTFLRKEDLLTDDEHRLLLDFALAREQEFGESGLYNRSEGEHRDAGFRRSRTLHGLDEGLWAMFEPHLHALLPHACRELGVSPFPLASIERQLHAHRCGDFFHRHVDNSGGSVASRRLSAVYYFYQQPKRFEGGALYLFDDVDLGTRTQAGPTGIILEPLDNSLVFFSSSTSHEVQPIRGADAAFSASRFTITFWFREARDGEAEVAPTTR